MNDCEGETTTTHDAAAMKKCGSDYGFGITMVVYVFNMQKGTDAIVRFPRMFLFAFN